MPTSKRRRRRHRRVQPGTRPGTIEIDKDALHPMIDVIQFDRQQLNRFTDVWPKKIPETREGLVTWINIVGLGNQQVIEQVAERFGIHELAVEGVVNTHQRPKLEVYENHLYLVLRIPSHVSAIQ